MGVRLYLALASGHCSAVFGLPSRRSASLPGSSLVTRTHPSPGNPFYFGTALTHLHGQLPLRLNEVPSSTFQYPFPHPTPTQEARGGLRVSWL